jgi:Ribosomal protein S26e
LLCCCLFFHKISDDLPGVDPCVLRFGSITADFLGIESTQYIASAAGRLISGLLDKMSTAGRVKGVRCEASGVMVPKDKAIKRFVVRNIVDASALRDIQDASAIEGRHNFPCSNFLPNATPDASVFNAINMPGSHCYFSFSFPRAEVPL